MSEADIRIEVTRNKGDYLSAICANYLHSGGIWWTAIGAIAFFIVGALLERDLDPFVAGASTASLFVAIATPLNALIIWRTAERSAKQPGACDPIAYTFTPEALEIVASLGSGVNKWAAYRRAFENGRVLVIRHHLNLMQFLPKRDIPAETLSRIRTLLSGALQGRVSFQKERTP